LAVSSTGALSGTPPSAGSFTFTATIADSGGASQQTGQTTATINVTAPTLAVPATQTFTGTAGVALSNQSLTASGGTPPYTWQAMGQPSWLTVSSAGALSGTPPSAGSFTFTATAIDSAQRTGQTEVTVDVSPFVPTGITLSVTPAQPTPVDQPQASVSVTNNSDNPLVGILVLTGPPDARFLSSNPEFVSANGQTLCFPIPANSSGPVTIDDSGQYTLGSVAGAVTITLSSITSGSCPSGSGSNLIESSPVSQSQTVPASAPIVSGVMASGTSTTGITIVITGFSNTRDLASAAFSFTSPSGTQVNGANQTVSLSQYAVPYFSSVLLGTFEYTQTFPYSGDAKAFPTSVSVTVSNSVGASTSTSSSITP
jgi:hypothetical protein